MTRRKPPEGMSYDEHRRWIDAHKNRNRHQVKFPNDLEEDFQAWKTWHNLTTNAAIKRLIETHPDLKKKP